MPTGQHLLFLAIGIAIGWFVVPMILSALGGPSKMGG